MILNIPDCYFEFKNKLYAVKLIRYFQQKIEKDHQEYVNLVEKYFKNNFFKKTYHRLGRRKAEKEKYMYSNKRPYQTNHIPHKLNYKYISKNKESNTLQKFIYKKLPVNNITENNVDMLSNLNNEEFVLKNVSFSAPDSKINFDKIPSALEEKIQKLDQQPPEFFVPAIEEMDDIKFICNYLYHGIRFQNHLEKLESIFLNKAILAGNYQNEYYCSYSDNCNEGEYISLTCVEYEYDLVYETFIMPNISLVISPKCNAIKTIYLNYEEWEEIKHLETKNRYSYAKNEYQVKQMIPLNMVKAIGLPARCLKLTNQEYLIEIYQNDIIELMNKYAIELPIVDTSNYNKILYSSKMNIIEPTLKKKKLVINDEH